VIKRLNKKPPLTTSIVILLAAVRNQFSAQSGFWGSDGNENIIGVWARMFTVAFDLMPSVTASRL
jgi:hypothetical protein